MCLVAQSHLTLCVPMDCSPPGSSVNGDCPGKNTGVGCHALLQEIFPTQGSDSGLPHCRRILYHLSHQGSPYDPAIAVLGIYPEKNQIQKDTCTPKFIAALCITDRTWKLSRCPLTDEWKKSCGTYTMKYYSAIKSSKFETVVVRCMNP